MVSVKFVALLFVLMAHQTYVLGQRSPYAGSRPTGYKDRFVSKQNQTANALDSANGVVNRFGDSNDGTQKPPMSGVQVVVGQPGLSIGNRDSETPISTARPAQPELPHLPYDAHGDVELVNLLLSRPVEQRPFWLINYEAIEAHRNSSRQGNSNPIATRSFFLGK